MTPIPLSRPPIVEALIDIQVPPGTGDVLEKLQALMSGLGSDFAPPTPIQLMHQQFDLSATSAPAPPTRGVLGYVSRSLDERRVAQGRLNGASFSILAPYRGWEELAAEMRAFWTRYVDVLQPTLVARVATRFINRISLEPVRVELKDWFETYPELGAHAAPDMSEFLVRLVAPMKAATGIVTLATEPADGSHVNIILDLDVFRVRELHPSTEPLWVALDELRREKNNLFFGSITQKTADLYQ